ncbi:MAG TPA: DUF222 domain-containing protein, partial [Solirubrobacteraceae bacterium]|nr:DUF222 domain-containing protein [Solirubrobacteraceae bacterium]
MCSVVESPVQSSWSCPPVAPSDSRLEDLEREICELAGHLAAGTCRWLLLIAEFDRLRGWASWGAKSCAHWLGWRCSLGPGTAREHVRVARSLAELTFVRTAFARGELSYCKVRAITRVATPETEERLVELGRHATGGQLERVVRGYKGALEATLENAQRVHERRRLNLIREDDGSVRVEGRLSAEAGALVMAALDAAERSTPPPDARTDPPTGDDCADTTAEMRRADALVELARTALAADESLGADGDPVELVVHVDAATLAHDQIQERCELDDGPSLAPETMRR